MSPIQIAVKEVVVLLVSGRTQEIVQRGMNGRLTVDEISHALSDYPGIMNSPPDEAYDNLNV